MREIKFRAWDEKYEIGSDGSVWSLDYNHTGQRKQLRQYLDQDGYPYVFLVHNRKRTKVVIHRAVAKLFVVIPRPPYSVPLQVNHKNGNRQDNRAENLEWCTSRENTLHGWRSNGRKFTAGMLERNKKAFGGINNPKAKITKEIAEQIRELRKSGIYLKDIAKNFGVSVSQVGAICSGRFWK